LPLRALAVTDEEEFEPSLHDPEKAQDESRREGRSLRKEPATGDEGGLWPGRRDVEQLPLTLIG
jgi:hypothetical protein